VVWPSPRSYHVGVYSLRLPSCSPTSRRNLERYPHCLQGPSSLAVFFLRPVQHRAGTWNAIQAVSRSLLNIIQTVSRVPLEYHPNCFRVPLENHPDCFRALLEPHPGCFHSCPCRTSSRLFPLPLVFRCLRSSSNPTSRRNLELWTVYRDPMKHHPDSFQDLERESGTTLSKLFPGSL